MSQPSVFAPEQASPFPLMHQCTLTGLLQTMIESSPIAVVALDARHRFSIGNAAFHSMFGYSTDLLQQADFDEAITTPETRDEARRLSAYVLQGKRVHANTVRRRSNGEDIQVEISGIPLIEDGRLAGIYGLYRCAATAAAARGDDPAPWAANAPAESRNVTEPLPLREREETRARLTEREQELIPLIARGFTSRGIARELRISVRTVESHRSHIHQKCGFKSVADLVRFAMLHQQNQPS